jgi:chromosome partitioning protein
MGKLLETTGLVARRINPSLSVSGIVLCLYESGTKLAQEVIADLEGYLEKAQGTNLPWSRARVFTTRIRRNIKLAECPSYGQTIFSYAPGCNGAVDYDMLAQEVLAESPAMISARVAIGERGQAEVLKMERPGRLGSGPATIATHP